MKAAVKWNRFMHRADLGTTNPSRPRPSAFIRVLPFALLASCAVGPNYERPDVQAPQAFKEAQGPWQAAQPMDAAPKGAWWTVFGDATLDELMPQVEVSNQNLRAAEARYRQAATAVPAARSAFFPTVGAGADAAKNRRNDNTSKSYSLTLDARWEVDLWGRVRRQVEAARAAEAASASDVENARLSLQAQLATNYFALRVVDVQRKLLEDSVKAFEGSYQVTQNRYKAGVAGKVDVVQSETQLLSTRAQLIDNAATRAQLEHAIAGLVGKAPAEFSLPPVDRFEPKLPAIPPGLPSTLLERRPDVAAAERRMAAANARIGVATAAYFPSLSLTGSGGYAAGAVASLVSSPNLVWSLGAGLAGTILDFGARSAEVDRSRAAYDEAVATYRQAVLDAFGEVEDNLSTVRILAEEDGVQQQAARAARESVALTLNQYKAGTVSFLNVAIVQAQQLSEERSTVQLQGRQLAASVGLIRALGGSW
jgi:NodT family efflux transporter outer membrane factor (OMF) lipoprotein